MNDIYDRQKTISLNTDKSVVIAGCGGIGYWAGLLSAMSGVKRLFLFDPDNIEIHNLNRLPVSMSSIGKPKVEVLREQIETLRPDISALTYTMKLTPSLLSVVLSTAQTTVIDCTDKYQSQVELSDFCHNKSIPYIRLGYNGGGHLTVADTVSKIFVGEQTPVNNYEIVPSWVIPAVMVATMGVMKLVYSPKFIFGGNVENIRG